MYRNRRAVVVALALCSVAVGSPTLASGQKGVLGTGANPYTGIVDPDSGSRYTALAAGEGTVVTKLDPEGGEVEGFRYLPRQLVVPSVAFDGSPSGLSADGETLVLSQPGTRFPQRRSEFTVLDTRRLRVTEELSFPGTFTFDAISPDGRSIYLVEYTSQRNLTEYLVREYDLRRGELVAEPILDPDESAEEMYGTPVNRVTSPDGRWAYTLYDGSEHPFIHALDTRDGTAVCIDLESLHRPVYGRTELRVSPDGGALAVVNGSRTVELVDLETFEVSEPPPAEPSAPPAAGNRGGGGRRARVGVDRRRHRAAARHRSAGARLAAARRRRRAGARAPGRARARPA